MIGILHHSPVTVSILLDRERIHPEFISEEDVKSGLWQSKISDFTRSQRDARICVLFVEKLAMLQAMLADGLETDHFKVVLYDDCNVLKAVPGIDIVDAGLKGAVWKTYTLLPEQLNDALVRTEAGVPEETAAFDPASAQEELPLTAQSIPAVPEGESNSRTLEMRQADAVMQGILNGDAQETPVEPPPAEDPKEEPAEPVVEPQEDQTPQEDDLEPEPPPKPKKKKKKKTKRKTTKRKAKKKAPTSCKLF